MSKTRRCNEEVVDFFLLTVKTQHWQVHREGHVQRDEVVVEGDLDPICPSLFEEGLPPQEQDDNLARGNEERQREQRVALDIIEEANMLIESVEDYCVVEN